MERFTRRKGTINKLQRANKQTDLRRDNKRLVCSWALRKQGQDGWGNDGCTKSVWLPRPYQIPRPLLSYPTSAWCPALPCPATLLLLLQSVPSLFWCSLPSLFSFSSPSHCFLLSLSSNCSAFFVLSSQICFALLCSFSPLSFGLAVSCPLPFCPVLGLPFNPVHHSVWTHLLNSQSLSSLPYPYPHFPFFLLQLSTVSERKRGVKSKRKRGVGKGERREKKKQKASGCVQQSCLIHSQTWPKTQVPFGDVANSFNSRRPCVRAELGWGEETVLRWFFNSCNYWHEKRTAGLFSCARLPGLLGLTRLIKDRGKLLGAVGLGFAKSGRGKRLMPWWLRFRTITVN